MKRHHEDGEEETQEESPTSVPRKYPCLHLENDACTDNATTIVCYSAGIAKYTVCTSMADTF